MPAAAQTSMNQSSSMPSKGKYTGTTDKSGRSTSTGDSTQTTQGQEYGSFLWKPSEDFNSENFLWRAVIGQAIYDIYRGEDKHRREVFRWLKSEDFNIACDFAIIEPERLRDAMLNLFTLPKNLSIKYGQTLRQKVMWEIRTTFVTEA